MAEALDGDPRVDRFELGIVGKWGESHDPAPTSETQQAIGQACQQYFHITPVTYRNTDQYTNFTDFGIYNDALMDGGSGLGMELTINRLTSLKDRWKTHPSAGEVPFTTPCHFPQLEPNDDGIQKLSLVAQDDRLVNWVINTSRYCHLSSMMGLYYTNDCFSLTGHDLQNFYKLHETIGYRYVMDQFDYPETIASSGFLYCKLSGKKYRYVLRFIFLIRWRWHCLI